MSLFDTTVTAPRTRDEQRERIERLIEGRHVIRPTAASIKRATSLLYTWEHVAAMVGVEAVVLDQIAQLPEIALEVCAYTAPQPAALVRGRRQDATEDAISGRLGTDRE